MTPVAPHIEAFLRDNLSRHRGASQHTCDSYAYSFQLLFEFAATKLRTKPSSLSLEQLDSELVSAFLEYLEVTRRNAPPLFWSGIDRWLERVGSPFGRKGSRLT